MERIIFLDGDHVPLSRARVSVMDRGFLFADGVYEVSAVLDGGLVDNDAHLRRLARSLAEIGIPDPYPAEGWIRHQQDLVERNGLIEGVVYIQVTRGIAEREFGFPDDLAPTVVMFTQAKPIIDAPSARSGVAVVAVPDLRWARRDIKSTGLLAQVMAKRQATQAGAAEAFLVEDGMVTEGGSSTAFIITIDNVIVTRPLSNAILPGITRLAVMRLASDHGLTLEERPFTLAEAHAAAEVFFTSASTFVMPVVSIDGRAVGTGRPGPHATTLRHLYIELALAQARTFRALAATRRPVSIDLAANPSA